MTRESGDDEGEKIEALRDGFQSAISSAPEPVKIHDVIRQDGERELDRSISALAWSPSPPWRPCPAC